MKTQAPHKRFFFLLQTILVFQISIFKFQIAFSQSPLQKQWDYRYGGKQSDFLNDFHQTSDGGFILGGFSISGISGDKTQPSRGGNDYWIVKTDANGIKQWDKRFGGSLSDQLYSVQQTSDGGYILGGYSTSNANGDKTQAGRGLNDYWILKLDATGTKLWDKRFGGTDNDFLKTVQQTTDGGYLLAGISRSDSSGDKTQPTKGAHDYWIVKTDSLGNKLWDADLGGLDDEQLSFMQLTSDGGCILGGSTPSGIGGDKTQATQGNYDYWIVKTDSLGNKQWDKDYGGVDIDLLQSLHQTNDGGYIVSGFSLSGISGDKTKASWGAEDYWIIKLDTAGNFQWDKDYGSTGTEDDVFSVLETLDGGYMICGESQSPPGGNKTETNLGISQAWIVKTDSGGSQEWEKTLLTSPEQKVNPYAIQTKNGCYAFAYASWAGIAGYKTQENRDTTHAATDYWIITYCDSTAQPLSAFAATNNICPGTCTSFNNLSLYATSYQWIFNGATITTSNDTNPQNICYNNPGNYNVTLIASNMSGSDTLTLANFINVYPYPPPQGITQSGDTLFAIQGSLTYQWYYNSTIVNGATGYFYVAPQSGNYNVICTDENGCEVEAAIFNVVAGIESAVNNLQRAVVYPNPVKEKLEIRGWKLEAASVRIYNMLGQMVLAANLTSNIQHLTSIDVSALEKGIYWLEISSEEKIFRSKFAKQ